MDEWGCAVSDNRHVSRIRVAAYVLQRAATWQLLVFDQPGHPQAGTQIPAGGVHQGESLAHAVLREISEETGLHCVTLRQQLHVEHRPHPRTGTPRTTTFFAADAAAGTPPAWTHEVVGRGTDAGMVFNCRFTPLPLRQPLADDQDAWLGLIDPGFTTLARRSLNAPR